MFKNGSIVQNGRSLNRNEYCLNPKVSEADISVDLWICDKDSKWIHIFMGYSEYLICVTKIFKRINSFKR